MKKRIGGWLKKIVIYGLCMFVLAAGVDWYRAKDMPASAPPLKGFTVDGLPVDVLAQSEKEPVIVYFWATWCSFCKVVSPTVSWFSRYYPVGM